MTDPTDITFTIEAVWIDSDTDEVVMEFESPMRSSWPGWLKRKLWGRETDEVRLKLTDAIGESCDTGDWEHPVSPDLLDTSEIQAELAEMHGVAAGDILIHAIHAKNTPCDVNYSIRDPESGEFLTPEDIEA